MKKMLAVAAIALTVVACNNEKGKIETQKTKGGLEYVLHVNEAKEKLKAGDVVELTFLQSRQRGDSVLNPFNKMVVEIVEPKENGDLMEGLFLMGVGDSASFFVLIDTLLAKSGQPLPPFFIAGDTLRYDIKIVGIKNEKADIDAYLQKENITTAPTSSGLIFVSTQPGTGKQAAAGKKVQVHYTGTVLDGTKFDSSVDRGEPFEFILGQGEVIPGWDEGIAMMKEGEKAKLIIPSNLAYGAQARSEVIQAYSTLIFEVELIKVLD